MRLTYRYSIIEHTTHKYNASTQLVYHICYIITECNEKSVLHLFKDKIVMHSDSCVLFKVLSLEIIIE